MFNSKQKQLFSTLGKTKKTSGNAFLNGAGEISATTVSGNGAKKYSTTGNDFVDQFGKISEYKVKREYKDISRDQSILWSEDNLKSVKFILFLRTITRKVNVVGGGQTEQVQRGSGLRHEAICRMLWLETNHPEIFYRNVLLFISVGSWKDIIQMLSYDLQYHGWNGRKLDWDKLGELLLQGLGDTSESELIKKFLPQIKSKSKCTTLESQADTMIGKWVCSLIFGVKEGEGSTYKKYRKLKSTGTAHEWQQLISKGKYKDIKFDRVPGRALSLLVNSKFLENQKLESKYDKWIESQPIAKYTGYVHELFKLTGLNGNNPISKQYQIKTLNSQFLGLVEKAKDGALKNSSLIVVRDTSGSMQSEAAGANMSSFVVAKGLALFFSYMLPEGEFANSWIEFNSNAKLHQWKGETPYEKFMNDRSGFVGSTNFQSVIDLFCDLKRKGVDEKEFPTGIVCISDGEFNPSQLDRTNVQTTFSKLVEVGFSKQYVDNFKIVLWNIPNSYYGHISTKFETFGYAKNVFYIAGYDGSILSFITGQEKKDKTPETAEELLNSALDQEVLNMVQ